MSIQLSVSVSLECSKAVIDHFAIIVPLARQSGSEVSLSFRPSSKVEMDAQSSNFNPFRHFLCFPMSAKSAMITLHDLLLFGGLSDNTVRFGSQLEFQLDKNNSTVWFGLVTKHYSAVFHLQANAQAGSWSEIEQALKKFKFLDAESFNLTSITVVVKRNMSKYILQDCSWCRKTSQLGLSFRISNFNAVMFCSPESYAFALRWKSGAIDSAKKLLKQIVDDSGSLGDLVLSSFKEALLKIKKSFDILQVSMEIPRQGLNTKPSMMAIDAQVTVNFGDLGEGKAVVFLLSFMWPQLLFCGLLYVCPRLHRSKLEKAYAIL